MKLFHRTSEAAAEAIIATRSWRSKENTAEVYFSTVLNGQTDGYGDAAIAVDVPEVVANLDDEFPDGEQHFRVSVADLEGREVTRER